MRKQLFLLAGFLLILFSLAACGSDGLGARATPTPDHEFAGTVSETQDVVPDFRMLSEDGLVQFSEFRGQYVFLYFGYTFCPDICPSTLADLARVRRDLGPDADKVQVLMITVDPERDTPEKLEEYVTFFDPTFIGLTGTQDAINAVGDLFGVTAEKTTEGVANSYLIDHSVLTFLVDPEGQIRVAYPFGVRSSDIVDDLRFLMEEQTG